MRILQATGREGIIAHLASQSSYRGRLASYRITHCVRALRPGALWPTWLAPSLSPDGPGLSALPCTQVNEGLDGEQS